MLSLIILVIFVFGMAYFATQNTGVVHILFGNYMLAGVPLYAIVIGSLLLGICISWLINITNAISSNITLHGKDTALQGAQQTITALREENHKLELEIAAMKQQITITKKIDVQENNQAEEESLDPHPSLFHRVRHSFG